MLTCGDGIHMFGRIVRTNKEVAHFQRLLWRPERAETPSTHPKNTLHPTLSSSP